MALNLPSGKPVMPEDELANRRSSHGVNPKMYTICIQQWFDGVLVHGVLSGTDTLDERNDGGICVHCSESLGTGRRWNEGLDVVPTTRIPCSPVIQRAFANAKGGNARFPPKVSSMFNNLYAESDWVMGIVHGRGGQCFHPDSIGTVGIFRLTVSYAFKICWHISKPVIPECIAT